MEVGKTIKKLFIDKDKNLDAIDGVILGLLKASEDLAKESPKEGYKCLHRANEIYNKRKGYNHTVSKHLKELIFKYADYADL